MMPEVQVVHTAVEYNCTITGNSTILTINNALYIRDMEHNLLPSIIMCINRLLVYEFPKLLCKNPTIETHSIFLPTENTRLTLAIQGTTSYISTRRPKGMSYINEYINLFLTSEKLDWDPISPINAKQ